MTATNIWRTLTAVIAVFLLTCETCAHAQASYKGTLNVKHQTISLDSLFIHSARSNYNQTTLEGFRIQIYSGSGVNSKDEAMAAQSRFANIYPDEKVYVIYNAPFWRVRVGDYRSRSEALSLLGRVKYYFNGSYVVRDNTVRKKTFKE